MKEELTKMGYREVEPNTWLKPVGYTLLVYVESLKTLYHYIKGKDGVIHIYTSKEVSTLQEIKDFEAYVPYSMGDPIASFELNVPIEERINNE